MYWRPGEIKYTITDVSAQIVPIVCTPVSLNDVKFVKLNTDTIMVADMTCIYNKAEDVEKMERLVEANSKGEPSNLPGHKSVHWNNYDILDVPAKCNLWETGIIQPEVPMFAYSFKSKVKLLRRTTEFLRPRVIEFDNIPIQQYDSLNITPHITLGTADQNYIPLPFDYSDGFITYPTSHL